MKQEEQNNSNLPQTPQPQVTLSANSQDIASPKKSSKKMLLYLMDAVLFIAILIVLSAVLPRNSKSTSSQTTHSPNAVNPGTQNTLNNVTNNSSIPNPTKNPVAGNGTINQEVKYCSNAINAELVC